MGIETVVRYRMGRVEVGSRFVRRLSGSGESEVLGGKMAVDAGGRYGWTTAEPGSQRRRITVVMEGHVDCREGCRPEGATRRC